MIRRLTRFIPAGSLVLGSTTLASYFLGMLRDRTFAQTYGASRSLDAYNAAFLLPDLLFNFLIASGIAAAVVPILTEVYKSDKKVNEYISSILGAATGVMISASVIIIIFADSISHVVAPGFGAEGQRMVADITRVLAVSPILFGISNTLGAILITKKRFLFYGLSPVFYNLGIILGTIFLSPHYGILGTAIGTVAGASVHMAIRLIDTIRSGFRFQFSLNLRSQEFKRTIQLMIPKMFGHPVELIIFWGFTVVASTLGAGAIAIMNFARNFQSVPVSIIGITFSTTAFPVMAQAISDNSRKDFQKALMDSFWLILGGSILAALAMLALREPLVRLILGGGSFTDEAIKRTAATLGLFTLSIPTESLRHLLARAFYATKNTTIPVVISMLGLGIAISGAYMFSAMMGILSIPLAFFLASFIEMILLILLIPRRLRKIYEPVIPMAEIHTQLP